MFLQAILSFLLTRFSFIFFLSPDADNLVLNIIKLLLNKTVRPLKIRNFVDHPRNWFSVVQLSQMQRG